MDPNIAKMPIFKLFTDLAIFNDKKYYFEYFPFSNCIMFQDLQDVRALELGILNSRVAFLPKMSDLLSEVPQHFARCESNNLIRRCPYRC